MSKHQRAPQAAFAAGEREFAKDFYVYQSEVLTIAAGANASDNINIQADSDFILYKLSFFATDITGASVGQTDSTRVLPSVAVQITDTGSGRQVLDGPLPIPAIFGTGELPFILPAPRRFAANSTISLSYSNFADTETYQLFMAFIGMKVYR